MLPENEIDTIAEQYRFEDGCPRNVGKAIVSYKLGTEYASGGAGCKDDFVKLWKTLPEISAGLAASIFHFGEVAIPDLKKALKENGINVRL